MTNPPLSIRCTSMLCLVVVFAAAAGAGPSGEPPQHAVNAQAESSTIEIGEDVTFESARLGGSRKIRIYRPESYANSSRRYPVVYVLDGEVSFLHTFSAVQFLWNNAMMPESIVVAICNTMDMEDRFRDMTPKPTGDDWSPPPFVPAYGGTDDFLGFICDELVPFIDQQYRTHPQRTIIGHSLGGLVVSYALVTRPAFFAGHVAMDSSIWWDNGAVVDSIEQYLREHPEDAGRFVVSDSHPTLGWGAHTERMTTAKSDQFMWEFIEIAGESHGSMPYRGIYRALKRMWADYEPEMHQSPKRASLAALDEQYEALTKMYGYEVDIPLAALFEMAQVLLFTGREAEAVPALQRAESLYPESPYVKPLLKRAREAAAAASESTDE